MPPQHRLGLHDHQGGAPLAPPFGEEDPKESIPPAELWALHRSGQRDQLGTEREVLERHGPVSPADQSDRSKASGTPCLDTFPVTDPGGVLLYMAEDPGHLVKARLTGLCRH